MPIELTPRPTGAFPHLQDATLPQPWVGIMLRPEWAGNEGDPQKMLDFCKRANDLGYNGLMLYDWDLSRPTVPDVARRRYDLLNKWAANNGWRWIVQFMPQGNFLKDAWGFDDLMFAGKRGEEWYVDVTV